MTRHLEALVILGTVVWTLVGIEALRLLRRARLSIDRFWTKIGFRLELAAEEVRKLVDEVEDITERASHLAAEGEQQIRQQGLGWTLLKSLFGSRK